MFDPRVVNLEELSDEELLQRVSSLQSMISFFASNGNTGAIDQIRSMLNDANAEQQIRWNDANRRAQEKIKKKNDFKAKRAAGNNS